jgi:hypothetical protein
MEFEVRAMRDASPEEINVKGAGQKKNRLCLKGSVP